MLSDEHLELSAEDYREYCLLRRRLDFLRMKASPQWRYRQSQLVEKFSDVATTRLVAQRE